MRAVRPWVGGLWPTQTRIQSRGVKIGVLNMTTEADAMASARRRYPIMQRALIVETFRTKAEKNGKSVAVTECGRADVRMQVRPQLKNLKAKWVGKHRNTEL